MRHSLALALLLVVLGAWAPGAAAGASPAPVSAPAPVAAAGAAPDLTEATGPLPLAGPGADPGLLLDEQVQALDTGPLETVLTEMNRVWSGYGPQLRLRDFIASGTRGEGQWQPGEVLQGLLRYLFREVVGNWGLLVKLVVLALLAALLQNLQNAFAHEATSRLAHAVVYLVLAGLALTGFGLAITSARTVMADLTKFMLALLPVLLTVLLGTGAVTTSALLHPLIPALVTGITTLMTTVVFPLIFLGAVLDIASGFNENLKLTQLAGLLRQGAMLVMGLGFTVFMGATAVKAAAGAVGDSVALRTAKYLTGALIPVVGKMFADAAELVWSSGLLLKNALGLLGMAAIFFIAIFPALKILSLIFVYRAAAAVVQPVGPGPIVNCLNTMAGALLLVFAAVATVALMFFISVTVLIGAANATVMMR